jgi:hypothetical protein
VRSGGEMPARCDHEYVVKPDNKTSNANGSAKRRTRGDGILRDPRPLRENPPVCRPARGRQPTRYAVRGRDLVAHM